MNLFEIPVSFFIQIHEYSMPHTREKMSMLYVEYILSTTKIMLELNTSCDYIWNWDLRGRCLKQSTETAQIDQCHLMDVGSWSHRTRLTTEYVIKNWLWLWLFLILIHPRETDVTRRSKKIFCSSTDWLASKFYRVNYMNIRNWKVARCTTKKLSSLIL